MEHLERSTILSILRIYDPRECNSAGVPLDWDRCRACLGGGTFDNGLRACTICDGHGSLKAAALAKLRVTQWYNTTDHNARLEDHLLRCESCGHPASEGTWEESFPVEVPLLRLSGHTDDTKPWRVHYSICDEECRHGGPGRSGTTRFTSELMARDLPDAMPFRASWRAVDVRTLGWSWDLRPERLAVLCLRCFVESTR